MSEMKKGRVWHFAIVEEAASMVLRRGRKVTWAYFVSFSFFRESRTIKKSTGPEWR